MNQPPSRRLARFVEPNVDDKRIDRVWAGVASRPTRSWPAWRLTAVAGVGAAAVVVLLLARSRATSPALAGVVVESGSSPTVNLADGTIATLRAGARLRYDRVQSDRVETTVERGEVAFDVHHTESRTFVVNAGKVALVDRGTRFVVDVEGDSVRVSVESGRLDIVRAASSETTIALTGGDSWTNGPAAARPTTAPPRSTPPAALEPPPVAGSEDATPTAFPSIAPVRTPGGPGPRELLQSATDARLAGHPREAAAAFDTLRHRFRDDPRAGLAAFELGRLRLDSLGDPAGAAEALADSIMLAPDATFREDAEARLVEAFDRMHDVVRCASAQKTYLARYPSGLHAASVVARCP